MAEKFKTTHKLDFGVADYDQPIDDGYNWQRFKVGTCYGLFAYRGTAFYILAIENEALNNGHFDDVLEWFEHACQQDGSSLIFLEVWNKAFLKHLITKRGFVGRGVDAVKRFEIKNPD